MLMAPTHPESQEGSVLCLHHIITAGGLVEGFESGGAQGAVVGLDLDVSAGVLELALVLQLLEIDLGHLSESPHGAEDDLLLARELELGAAQSLSNIGLLGLAGADAHQGLANADTGHNTLGLTEGTTHTSLESISSSAGKHFVDAGDLEGVSANADVEGVLADFLDHVLVAANAGSLQSLAGDLLVLHGQQVGTQRELINASLLAAHVKDADLGIRDTTAVPRLDVRAVLDVAVATSRSTSHGTCEWSTANKQCPSLSHTH